MWDGSSHAALRSMIARRRVSGNTVTLIDVTNAKAPFLVASAPSPNGQADDLLAIAGTEALAVSAGAEPGGAFPEPETVRIVSFADPEHPTVAREFAGVTAVGRDNQRALVFLANSEGVWILRERLAEDPAVVQAYADYVLYSH